MVLSPTYITTRVQQFTFLANPKIVACILREIRGITPLLEQQVFIGGLLEVRLKKNQLVKLIPGAGPDEAQNALDIRRTKEVLRKYCVNFRQDTVLFAANQIGSADLDFLDAVLLVTGNKVNAKYTSYFGVFVVEVSDLEKAEQVLKQPFEFLNPLVQRRLEC
jgi:hypothetical protein